MGVLNKKIVAFLMIKIIGVQLCANVKCYRTVAKKNDECIFCKPKLN